MDLVQLLWVSFLPLLSSEPRRRPREGSTSLQTHDRPRPLGIHFGAFWHSKSITTPSRLQTTFSDDFGPPLWLLFGIVLDTFPHLLPEERDVPRVQSVHGQWVHGVQVESHSYLCIFFLHAILQILVLTLTSPTTVIQHRRRTYKAKRMYFFEGSGLRIPKINQKT